MNIKYILNKLEYNTIPCNKINQTFRMDAHGCKKHLCLFKINYISFHVQNFVQKL